MPKQLAEEEKFKLRDFKDLIEKLPSLSLPDNCIQWYSDNDTLYLIRLSFTEPAVSVDSTVTINSSLNVEAFRRWEINKIYTEVINYIRQIETILLENK